VQRTLRHHQDVLRLSKQRCHDIPGHFAQPEARDAAGALGPGITQRRAARQGAPRGQGSFDPRRRSQIAQPNLAAGGHDERQQTLGVAPARADRGERNECRAWLQRGAHGRQADVRGCGASVRPWGDRGPATFRIRGLSPQVGQTCRLAILKASRGAHLELRSPPRGRRPLVVRAQDRRVTPGSGGQSPARHFSADQTAPADQFVPDRGCIPVAGRHTLQESVQRRRSLPRQRQTFAVGQRAQIADQQSARKSGARAGQLKRLARPARPGCDETALGQSIGFRIGAPQPVGLEGLHDGFLQPHHSLPVAQGRLQTQLLHLQIGYRLPAEVGPCAFHGFGRFGQREG